MSNASRNPLFPFRTDRTLAVACAALALVAGQAAAQSTATAVDAATTAAPAAGAAEFTPRTGQAGKDVIWVPTPQELVDQMLNMAELKPGEMLIDLGSGDGRTVISAARRGFRAHGIEYNPDMVALSRRNAEKAGVADRATFAQADIFASDFGKASVITLFLLPHLNVKLRPTLLEMKPGTRILSNSFDMAEWQPDETWQGGESCGGWCRAYKWVVPARVEGAWQLGSGTLELQQTFQMLAGTLTRDGKASPITDAKMTGSAITFTVDGRRYSGQVNEGAMSGQIEGGSSWSATPRRTR